MQSRGRADRAGEGAKRIGDGNSPFSPRRCAEDWKIQGRVAGPVGRLAEALGAVLKDEAAALDPEQSLVVDPNAGSEAHAG